MSGYGSVITFGGAASPTNPNETYEALGYGSNGRRTIVSASGSTNTKGGYTTIGTTAAAWAGFFFDIGGTTGTAARYLFDIRINGTTVIFPDFFCEPSISAGMVFVPLQVVAGTLIAVRCQSGTASANVGVGIIGVTAASSSHPGFATATQLVAADTGTTRASTINVTPATSISYTQLIASTAVDYGALLAIASHGSTIFGIQQDSSLIIATGAAASEVEIARLSLFTQTAVPAAPRTHRLIRQSVPSGTRLSAAVLANAADNPARVNLYGFA